MPTTDRRDGADRRAVAQVTIAAWVLIVPLRLFLAVGWARAAAEKFVDDHWWSGAGVREFLDVEQANAMPFIRPVMDHVFAPQAQTIAVVVALAQVGIAVSIATGRFMRVGLWAGVVLNVVFVACGRVNPSAFYLVMELALLLVVAERRRATVPTNPRRWVAGAVGWSAVAVACLPMIDSLEPSSLILEPAAMFSLLAGLAALANAIRWGLSRPGGNLHRFAEGMVHWAYGSPRTVPSQVVRQALPDLSGRSLEPPRLEAFVSPSPPEPFAPSAAMMEA